MFSKVRERLRDHARDKLCARLQALGIPAQMVERVRREEKITSSHGSSKGVIDIASGPIRWVNIKKSEGAAPSIGLNTVWRTEYGIPDPNIGVTFPAVHIESALVKHIPLIGEVIDLAWKGDDVVFPVIKRLTGDDSLRQFESDHYALTNEVIKRLTGDDALREFKYDYYELTIETYPKHGCWMLTVKGAPVPSGMHWNCYQAIADHLLAVSKR